MTRLLLLDTQAFLWFTMDDPSLSLVARDAIEDAESVVRVSWATAWEMGIKYHRGLLKLPEEPRVFFEKHVALNRFEEAPIVLDTILASTELPWHHRDPFDRILVAEALRKSLEIVSSDPSMDSYGARRIW